MLVQDTLKEMRKAHTRRDIRGHLERGVSELLSGRGDHAMAIYNLILGEDAKYAEAWNRLATCQYMYGRSEESLESTKKTLELDPNHVVSLGWSLVPTLKSVLSLALTFLSSFCSLPLWVSV